MSSPEEKAHDLGRPGGRRLYDRGGFATLASKLFLPAHWFVDQYRSHEGPAIREQEQRVADATGQAREIEKMVAGILAGPVRRVAYYSVVHAVYSGFEIGLLELCRAIAQKGCQPKNFDFLRAEIDRQTGRQATIPFDEHHQEFVDDLVRIRHCIAHATGEVTRLRSTTDQTHVRAAVARRGLSLSQDGFVTMDDAQCTGLIANVRACFAVIVGDVDDALSPQPIQLHAGATASQCRRP